MENLTFFANSGAKLLASTKDLYAQYNEVKEQGDESAGEFVFGVFVSFLKKKMPFEKVSGFLKSVKEKRGAEELKEVIEGLWLVGLFVEGLQKQVEEREYSDISQALSNLVRLIGEEKVSDEVGLFDQLSEGQMKTYTKVDERIYGMKRRKWNTKIFFFQTKYNLFSQQNEGYSKLLALLLDCLDDQNPQQLYESIISIIGYFDLDPDRVVESMLNIFIFRPTLQATFREILRHFSKQSISNFLGKKFEHFASLPEKCSSITFQNAILAAANLIKAEVISIDSIWPYLSPTDAEFEEASEEVIKNAIAYYQDSYSMVLTISEEDAKKKREEEEKQSNFTSKFVDNQKLWLLDSLVKVNAWGYFQQVHSYLYNYLDLKMHPHILNNLLKLFEWGIDKVYQQISPSRYFQKKHTKFPQSLFFDSSCSKTVIQLQQANSVVECFSLIENMLRIIKGYIGCSAILYTKVLRVLRYILSSKAERSAESTLDNEIIDEETQKTISNTILELLSKYMLPGVNMFECNTGVVADFWSLFKRYDYRIRLKVYMDCHMEYILTSGFMLIKQGKAVREIKDILNKFNLENKKLYSKKIVKIANNAPFVIQSFVARRLLQISYENLIPDMLGSFQYGTGLGQDIFIYLILQYIYDKKQKNGKAEEKFEESKGSIAAWFRIASLFISNFYKKFHNADMMPIVMYLINSFDISSNLSKSMIKAHSNVAIDLFIFKDLLAKMSGFEMPNILNDSQLQALAGGITLQVQSLKLNEDVRKCKKSQKALDSFLMQKMPFNSEGEVYPLAYHFLLLLGQEKSKFFDSYYYGLSTMEIFFDTVSDCLNLLIFFLRFQGTYSDIMPPKALRELILHFKISPEIAFQIVRPGLRPLPILQKEELQKVFGEIKEIYENLNFKSRFITKTGMERDDEEKSQTLEKYEENGLKRAMTVLKPELISAFWLLSLENISMNKEGYKQQIDGLKKQIAEKQAEKYKKDKDKKDKDKNKELKDLDQLVKKLDEEDLKQTKLHQKYDDFLNSIKDSLILPQKRDALEQIITELLTFCILPRVVLEQNEALYCSRFLLLLLKISQQGLNDAVRSIRQAIQKILPFIQIATEKEALNISIFINDILKPFQNYLDGSDKLQQSLRTHIHPQIINDKYVYEKYSSYIHNSVLDEMFKTIQQMSKGDLQERNVMILLNSLKDIFPKTNQQVAESKKFMEFLKAKTKSQGQGVRIGVYLNSLTSLKNLPDAPAKLGEREKKGVSQLPIGAASTNSVEKQSKKDKSRERSQDRNKEKKDDRYPKKDMKKGIN